LGCKLKEFFFIFFKNELYALLKIIQYEKKKNIKYSFLIKSQVLGYRLHISNGVIAYGKIKDVVMKIGFNIRNNKILKKT